MIKKNIAIFTTCLFTLFFLMTLMSFRVKSENTNTNHNNTTPNTNTNTNTNTNSNPNNNTNPTSNPTNTNNTNPNTACSLLLKPGAELKYVASLNDQVIGFGSLKIRSNPDKTRWSGTQINLAAGGLELDLNGRMDGNSFILFNPNYEENWVGSCNSKGIAGKINDKIIFIFFKDF